MRAMSILMISSLIVFPAAAEPPANPARRLPPELQGKAGCSALQAAFAQAPVMRDRPALDPVLRNGEALIQFINGRGPYCTWYGMCSIYEGGTCKKNSCNPARLSRGRGNNVILEATFDQPMPAREMFVIERNMAIPAVPARQLGARGALVLRKGKYRPTLANEGRTIRVELPVTGRWGPPERDLGA